MWLSSFFEWFKPFGLGGICKSKRCSSCLGVGTNPACVFDSRELVDVECGVCLGVGYVHDRSCPTWFKSDLRANNPEEHGIIASIKEFFGVQKASIDIPPSNTDEKS